MANIINKIVVIVGTTAAGKTSMAVDLAYRFNGEVVSADSRQVYKYMDIGSGKDLADYRLQFSNVKCRMSNNLKNDKIHLKNAGSRNSKFVDIAYHCIDLVHPNTEFSLGKWYKAATKALDNITEQGRVPIVAGGTGLYTQALVDGYNLSGTKPDKKLRAKLGKLSVEKLYNRLKKLNNKFAKGIHESDRKNKRRLIRYIEIILQKTQNPPHPGRPGHPSREGTNFNSLVIGLTWPQEVLKKRIDKRLLERIEKEQMIEEVENLHKKYRVSWKRLNDFGLEYRYVSKYLRGKIDYVDMVEELSRAIYQFSRRQMSWLRRWERQGQKIHWTKNKIEARKLVKNFLK